MQMESAGRLPLPRRRLALFLLVLVVPFVVLVALAIRTLEQERELAVRRATAVPRPSGHPRRATAIRPY